MRPDRPGIAKAKRTAELLEEAVEAGGHGRVVRVVLGELDALLDRVERRAAQGWGDPERGGMTLIRSDAGSDAEALVISWNARRIETIEIKPRPGFNFEHADAAAPLLEALVPLLWRYVREGGRLPPGAERFATFFTSPVRADGSKGS